MTSFLIRLIGVMMLFSPSSEISSVEAIDVAPPAEEIELSVSLQQNISAQSIAIYDLTNEGFVYKKNAEERRPMASLTKLMTALVIMENHSPNEVVKVDAPIIWEIEPAKINLLQNERMTVRNMMKAILIPSGNDAALALAIFDTETKTEKGSVQKFVQKMNKRAKILGLINTSFKNPHGLDAVGHYSTAEDLALLTKYLFNYKNDDWDGFFRKTVGTKFSYAYSTDGVFSHELKTTNDLLDTGLPVYGVKTGFTDEAGQCLITMIKEDKKEFIIVLMGSKDRFGDTKKIIAEML